MKRIALSFFHRKIGPLVYFSYPDPKSKLDEDLSIRIANIMDQTVNEGFFTHSFGNFNSLNYYFEIHSDWARGNKEMLMVSIIFDKQPSIEVEQKVISLLIDFSRTFQVNEEIFAAFYLNEINYYEEDKGTIIKNDELVKDLVKDLYRTVIEETRDKSEEEEISILLKERYIFSTHRKLSKGPITYEALCEWFKEYFTDKNFEEMLDTLAAKQIININEIGWTKYILLLKEINAERIPPFSIIEYMDKTPELIDLILPKVQEYFSIHENRSEKELREDAFILFQIMSDPKKYNILSELRGGLIPKEKLPQLVSKRALDSLQENLDYLNEQEMIEEVEYDNETYLFLICNFQITTAFPRYLRKLLPDESKPVIANKYDPKRSKLENRDKQ